MLKLAAAALIGTIFTGCQGSGKTLIPAQCCSKGDQLNLIMPNPPSPADIALCLNEGGQITVIRLPHDKILNLCNDIDF